MYVYIFYVINMKKNNTYLMTKIKLCQALCDKVKNKQKKNKERKE